MTVSQNSSPNASRLRDSLDRDLLAQRLRALVKIPSESPPGEEQAVGAFVADECRTLGMEVRVVEGEPGRPNIIATTGGPGGRKLIYCTHLDVVPAGDRSLWRFDPYAAEVVDGRVHGRGACDAKGCIAAALEAARLLQTSGTGLHGTLELHLVSDEETMGFKGAGYLRDQGLLKCDAAIVGEPTSLRIVIAQRGAAWMRITTRGAAAHGSAPERGTSAIRHMAELVLRLEETLPATVHPVLGGPSINVGTIRGGEKVNIVPAACVAEIDRRTIPGETMDSVVEAVDASIELARRRFPDLDATVEVLFAGDPFETPADARVVRDATVAVEEATGKDAERLGFRGASDARFFAEEGADVIVWGPGDIALAHTARESIELAEVERAAVAYALAFGRLLAPA